MPQGTSNRAATNPTARKGGASAFDILRSKLDRPRARPGLVERTALVERLVRSRGARFVSVLAPPGYGKTTALGQWEAKDPRPFAWVSLDHRDNDPVLLLTYVATALQEHDDSVDSAILEALRAPGESLWGNGLPRLGAALAARAEPVVLVLDDVHLLEDRQCLDALVALAHHVPADSQLVFSGRTEADVGLATMRADRDLVEVDQATLALTDAQAHLLLTGAGADVTPAEAAVLNERAEGWAAGLYLAALAIAGGSSSPSAFHGDDRFVTDYLRAEELSRTGAKETEFLLRSSVLESMDGPMCDAVLERSGSARMLEKLEDKNLFVVALDHTRTRFRYHHLFREMLEAELERRDPALAGRLRTSAASWCEANGRPEEAIEYASAASDTATLARLIAANALPYYRSGRVATVERWLSVFDDNELLRLHPSVTVFGAVVHALRGARLEVVDRWAAALDSVDPETPMPDGTTAEAWTASARALLCRKGVEQMKADAEQAMAQFSRGGTWRHLSVLLAGISALLSGDEERAEALFGGLTEGASADGALFVVVAAHSQLALLALGRGDLEGAELALAGVRTHDSQAADYMVNGLLLAVTARVALARGQGARARQALAAAQRLRPVMTAAVPWLSVQVRFELAKAHLSLRDPRGAATLYHEAEEILRWRPRLGTLVAEAAEIRARITSTTAEDASGWAATLTEAELRLLPLLTTHLSFREIAERLFVSRNTVKTQAISVYRKLDASSRSEAIERAVELGLVDVAPAARSGDFTRSG